MVPSRAIPPRGGCDSGGFERRSLPVETPGRWRKRVLFVGRQVRANFFCLNLYKSCISSLSLTLYTPFTHRLAHTPCTHKRWSTGVKHFEVLVKEKGVQLGHKSFPSVRMFESFLEGQPSVQYNKSMQFSTFSFDVRIIG